MVRSTATLAGQAQKEFFVNQSLCVLDALHARAVVASQPAPPTIPAEGDYFRVTGLATQAWSGHEGDIAVQIGGDWHFIRPQEGMQLFDKAAGHVLVFRTVWEQADAPALPTDGPVIDTEARAAIGLLIQSLLTVGVLSAASP